MPKSNNAINLTNMTKRKHTQQKVQLTKGTVQIDVTVLRIRRFFRKQYLQQYIAVDTFSRTQISKIYKTRNTHNAIDFVNHIKEVLQIPIQTIQTDMALEFQTKFREHLTLLGIKHLFISTRENNN